MTIRERWLPLLMAGAFVALMVGAAQASGLSEVLFPETLAILCGAWIQPRQAWNIDRPRMLLLMGSGAVFGLCMNLLVPPALPGSLWARAVLGYAFCALAMRTVGADMTPMLSAAILPVLLGTDSWLYPLVVVTLVALICLGQIAFEHAGLREPIAFKPKRLPLAEDLRAWGLRLAVFALVSAPFYLTGNKLFCVPPLIVAYTSLTRPDMTLRLRPWRAFGVLALAAVIGSLGRAVVEGLGAPLVLTVIACYALLVLAWRGLATWLPPAGAALLLAFLVPYAGPFTYAAEVSIGATMWTAAAMAFPGIRPSRG